LKISVKEVLKMPSAKDAKEYVLNVVKEQKVKFIKLWFTDILGFSKSFAITAEELPDALEGGMGFDGSCPHRGK
jgi:glutamine synthetase